MPTAVLLERGKKKVFVSAVDWPGWSRGAGSDEEALETLASYADRYRPVAERAGFRFPKNAADAFDVVEHLKGDTSTDFGVPHAIAEADHQAVTRANAKRLAAFVQASWDTLADAAAASPAALKKGPRGGGRDRDKLVQHVVDAEYAYARKVGVRHKPPKAPGDVEAMRADLLAALATANDGSPVTEKGWPTRYAARRIAWHVLDHVWEMEDKRP